MGRSIGDMWPQSGTISRLAPGILAAIKADTIDLITLHAAGLVTSRAKKVKIVLKGEITRAIKLSGVLATAGAKAAIEAAGGSVE